MLRHRTTIVNHSNEKALLRVTSTFVTGRTFTFIQLKENERQIRLVRWKPKEFNMLEMLQETNQFCSTRSCGERRTHFKNKKACVGRVSRSKPLEAAGWLVPLCRYAVPKLVPERRNDWSDGCFMGRPEVVWHKRKHCLERDGSLKTQPAD